MLRHFVVLAVMAFCLSSAEKLTERTVDKDFVMRQKSIFDLMWHVQQPLTVVPEMAKMGQAWNIKDNIASYTNELAVKEFLQRYNYGMLPRGEVFSMAVAEHREEAIALFHIFYYAKDWDTFYKTAMWARVHVNEGQFVYALTVAVIHREDTKHMQLPSPWEVSPFMFFNSEVIQRAQKMKMEGVIGGSKSESGVMTAVIPANYSGWYMKHDLEHEQKLNYFIEDIGLNAYYFYFHQDFPFWMTSEKYGLPKGYRGEQYYYGHKQLLARYYLERLSNGLGEIENFDWNKPFPIGYYPTMSFQNGLPMPQREHRSVVPSWKFPYVQKVKDLESRITHAIDSGLILTEDGKIVSIYTDEGFDVLGNIIQGNADSYNREFYGSVVAVAKHILGFNPETKYQAVPSALEKYTTSLRDPAFFRLWKRVMNYFLSYKKHLQVYTHDELVFPGVEIESVEVDKLVTYFEQFDAFINNAVMVKSQEDAESFVLKARQLRLSHKPFSYHITVKSTKKVKAVVRVFLGPKYNGYHHELNITENYMNFVELDQWIVDLTTGVNKIERSSHESVYTMPDQVSADVFHAKMTKVIADKGSLTYKPQLLGFPERLQLPKGRKEGMPFQLFVCVSEFVDTNSLKIDSPLWGKVVLDGRSMGFPLDRPMHAFNFTVPNMRFHDVLIFHKEEREINVTV